VKLSDAAALGSVIHLRAHSGVLGRVLVAFGVANLASDLAVSVSLGSMWVLLSHCRSQAGALRARVIPEMGEHAADCRAPLGADSTSPAGLRKLRGSDCWDLHGKTRRARVMG
jgi:hypothetical protein